MSLDLSLETESMARDCTCPDCGDVHAVFRLGVLWSTNITHNLGPMFDRAGVYHILWHGTGALAADAIPELEAGLSKMLESPETFKAFNSPNGWGTYEGAVSWLQNVILNFKEYPEGIMNCSR